MTATTTTPALLRHHADGRVHFSELKQMADCPAEYAYACATAREMTDAMEVGHLTDCLVFGQRGYAVYDLSADGKRTDKPLRRGKVWDQFLAEHPGVLCCLPSQLERAQAAAAAVLAHPIARVLLEGCEFQRVIQWEAHGLLRAAGIAGERGGLDALNVRPRPDQNGGRPYLLDLKATATTEPIALAKHAWRMLWHVQGADYCGGVVAAGLLDSEPDFKIVAVKSSPPHTVTILRVGQDVLEHGRKSLIRWSERLRACDRTGYFPGYTEVEEDMTVPDWEQE
jgi:PDDEXK-like domain of unknown function (DUF3799)